MNKQKILIVTQYFYPESFKGNDIATELVKMGYNVTVLTTKPNYPKGKFYNGYGFLKKRKEVWNDVKIIRCPVIPRGSNNFLLVLNYLSFILFASFAVIFRLKKDRDIVFIQQLSPVFVTLPAILYKRLSKAKIYLWVLDLWPESMRATLGIQKGLIYSGVERIVKYSYNNSDKILISSKGFEKSIRKKTDKTTELMYFPNWAEDFFVDYELYDVPEFPNGFNVLFAGNVGEAQDFDSVLNAAKLTINDCINWIIVGDGRKKGWIEKQIKDDSITNVYLLGRFPIQKMASFFKKSDAMLVSLKDDEIFGLTVPAKIQAYLASGKIILGMINGEAANIIKDSNAGLCCDSGDYDKLASNAKLLAALGYEEKLILEGNAKKFYKSNFEKKMLIHKLEEFFTIDN